MVVMEVRLRYVATLRRTGPIHYFPLYLRDRGHHMYVVVMYIGFFVYEWISSG